MNNNKKQLKKELSFNNKTELQSYIIERFSRFGDKVKYNFKVILS